MTEYQNPLEENENYQKIISDLKKAREQLTLLEEQGNLDRDNAALIGDYLTRIRLHLSPLYDYDNALLDEINRKLRETDASQEKMYKKLVESGKSENAAKNHSGEMHRVARGEIKILENHRKQIENTTDQYDGIVMSLQSRLKEFNMERIAG